MSNDCRHNDHGHGLLWLCLFLMMMGACDDCDRGYADLESRVNRLENGR